MEKGGRREEVKKEGAFIEKKRVDDIINECASACVVNGSEKVHAVISQEIKYLPTRVS